MDCNTVDESFELRVTDTLTDDDALREGEFEAVTEPVDVLDTLVDRESARLSVAVLDRDELALVVGERLAVTETVGEALTETVILREGVICVEVEADNDALIVDNALVDTALENDGFTTVGDTEVVAQALTVIESLKLCPLREPVEDIIDDADDEIEVLNVGEFERLDVQLDMPLPEKIELRDAMAERDSVNVGETEVVTDADRLMTDERVTETVLDTDIVVEDDAHAVVETLIVAEMDPLMD